MLQHNNRESRYAEAKPTRFVCRVIHANAHCSSSRSWRCPLFGPAVAACPIVPPSGVPSSTPLRDGDGSRRQAYHGSSWSEFFHHGEIEPDGRNVVVAAQNSSSPCRILQLGPGDFCRLAFQTVRGQRTTRSSTAAIAADRVARRGPAATDCCWRPAQLQGLQPATASNRSATPFDAARPIGADYVESVHHACNPFRREARSRSSAATAAA